MFEDVSNLFIEEAVFFIIFFQFISGMPKTCYAFNYYTLCKKIEVKDSAIEFLKEQGILKTSVKCKWDGVLLLSLRKVWQYDLHQVTASDTSLVM